MQSKRDDTASEEETLDTITINADFRERSASNHRIYDVDTYPGHDLADDSAKFPGSSLTDDQHRF